MPSALWTACASGAKESSTTTQAGDPKRIATTLQTKTQTLITALKASNTAAATSAKQDLEKELDRADEALKSDPSKEAGQVTTAISNIRLAMLRDDIARLERQRDQLVQVAGQ